MATAVGTYAIWNNGGVGVRQRLTPTGATFGTQDDAMGQRLCDQVNGWIEAKTGRIFAPYPLIATTVSSGGGAGSQSVTLASGTGINIGDALLFGTISGTHEHGIVRSVAGAVVGLQSPLVATYGAATAVERCQLFDVEELYEGGRLVPISNGIVSAANLETAFYTGGSYSLIPPTDWFLRPTPLEREPGWPATELWMTDIPSSGNPSPTFSRGIATVRLSGSVQPGWPATPDEIVGLAEKLVVAVWRTRTSGGGQTITVGVDGERQIEMAMTAQDWQLIKAYSAKDGVGMLI